MFAKIKAGLKIAQEVAPVAPTTPEKDVPIQPSMEPLFSTIKAGLKVVAEGGEAVTTIPQATVTEEAPLLPYEQMGKLPPNFPIEDYSLKPLGDERVAPILKTLDGDIASLAKLDSSIGVIKAEAETKIQELKQLEGYEKVQQEIAEYSKKFSEVIQRELVETKNSYQASKNILLEYKDKIYTIYDSIKKTSVSDKEKLQMYQEAMSKLLAPDLVKSVNDLVSQGVKQMEKAKTAVNRRFISFPTQDKLRKMVKEELPKKAESKTAGVWDSIKGFLSGLWEGIKELFLPIKENAADIQMYLEENISPLLGE